MSDAELIVRFLPQARAKVNTFERRLTGYPIVFNSLSQDLGGFREQIKPEAVDRTLTSGTNVDALIDHRRDSTAILGSTDSGLLRLEKDRAGVRAVIRPPDTAVARDVLEVVKAGLVRGMSFAFRVMPDGDTWDDDPNGPGYIRTITDMVFSEVSIVLNPAYLATEINARTAAVDRRSMEAARALLDGYPERQYREDLLQAKGLLLRGAIPSHSTATDTGTWDGPTMKARLRTDGGRAYFRKAFAWVDASADPDLKGSYKFIHHEVSADGTIGPANLMACSTGIGVCNGGRTGTTIPRADIPGVYAHLARHLRDGGQEPPALKS